MWLALKSDVARHFQSGRTVVHHAKSISRSTTSGSCTRMCSMTSPPRETHLMITHIVTESLGPDVDPISQFQRSVVLAAEPTWRDSQLHPHLAPLCR